MAVVTRVEEQPDLGRLRRDLHPADNRTLRLRGFRRYLLFYRWVADSLEVEVLRMLRLVEDAPAALRVLQTDPQSWGGRGGGDQGVRISKSGAAWAKCEGLRVTMRTAPLPLAKVACSES